MHASRMHASRRLVLTVAAVSLSLAAGFCVAQNRASGPPVRIGGTLPLTGPLGPAGLVNKIASDIAIEQINRRGGFLGRPV